MNERKSMTYHFKIPVMPLSRLSGKQQGDCCCWSVRSWGTTKQPRVQGDAGARLSHYPNQSSGSRQSDFCETVYASLKDIPFPGGYCRWYTAAVSFGQMQRLSRSRCQDFLGTVGLGEWGEAELRLPVEAILSWTVVAKREHTRLIFKGIRWPKQYHSWKFRLWQFRPQPRNYRLTSTVEYLIAQDTRWTCSWKSIREILSIDLDGSTLAHFATSMICWFWAWRVL